VISVSVRSDRGVYAATMRVEVNTELCQGHNRCYALAPELFDVDDYGTAMVIGDGTVPAELEEKARLAAANCPEYAITVTDD
jgi:ferredoxin